MIADQEIEINGFPVNIHDLQSIEVDGSGRIVGYYRKERPGYEILMQELPPQLELPPSYDSVIVGGYLLQPGETIASVLEVQDDGNL
jgi:hypothetical protein